MGERHGQIKMVGLLADPVRRSLYELVVASDPDDVSRDRAAEALDIRRGLAAFHLDKLVAAGLLETQYRRPSGVGGPGAGRPTKYYRRSQSPVVVSLPPRRFELMGRFLVEAVTGPSTNGLARARRAARAIGRRLGAGAGRRSITDLFALMKEEGFEPLRHGRQEIVLRNCPFHELAADHKDTVCEINLAFHQGVLAGLSTEGLSARQFWEPGYCCVAYSLTERAASSS